MTTESVELPRYPAMEKPPVPEAGAWAWLRRNLFSSPANTAVTLVIAAVSSLLGWQFLRWSVDVARWGVITSNLRVILWGRFPAEEVWRPQAATALLGLLTGLTWIIWRRPGLGRLRRPMLIAWLASPVVIGLLLGGFEAPTLSTISNNLGYFLLRPDLLPILGATWRGPLALLLVATIAALTWASVSGRARKALALLPFAVLIVLNLPAAFRIFPGPAGLPIPMGIPILLAALAGWWGGRSLGHLTAGSGRERRWMVWLWLATGIVALYILTSFDVGRPEIDPAQVLSEVQPSLWSGILLTMVLSILSILLSFPLGVALALGRTSRLPVIRYACVGVIEIVRGVPLIAILFMAQVMLPMFLPLDLTIDRVLRAIAGMTIFTAAYLAEIVRGGVQAVPREQLQAARALGLSEFLVTLLVLLPQALRAVIPAILGQFVSIFKDTSLVSIVGLLDLLGILASITKQREYLGTVREVYLFAAIFYFVVSYGMSAASRRLEARLGVGTR
jgi:general L-amino acid transport system permease protein